MIHSDRICPWTENPAYWQYRGQPVLLMGGSREDNLFQIPDVKEHLELLSSVGGNYIRNTMSDRDNGDEYPYARLPEPPVSQNGGLHPAADTYDLDTWNPVYWEKFERLLRLCTERDIIVQLEIWDRFDLSDAKGMFNWQRHPYNPGNNVNYSYGETGFAAEYPDHPGRDLHPFYHSVPGMAEYRPEYDTFRAYQEKYLDKLLSLSLPCGNVLYCMNNETSTEPAWGQYWMRFIRSRAADAGVNVYCTDMFDDAWKPEESASLRMVLNDPETYDFIETSQVNSRNFGPDHWRRVNWIRNNALEHPRPRNNVKIYSDGNTGFGSGTPQDGIQRFWQNLLGGCASVRFHRNGAGIGLNTVAQACIKAARTVNGMLPFRSLTPCSERIKDNADGNACMAGGDDGYMLYVRESRKTVIGLSLPSSKATITWIDIATGQKKTAAYMTIADGVMKLQPPGPGPVAAVIEV